MIEYTITLDYGRTFRFKVDPERTANPRASRIPPPEWTKLEFNQCSNCPLKPETSPHCPVAVDVVQIIAAFKSILSYENVNVTVTTADRTYSKRTDAQTGLRSYLGLVMATSACPYFSRLKGLARFHLPFATMEETIFRTTGAYLIQQYFVLKDGGTPDLELRGLKEFYDELQTVNRCFKLRVDAASELDANMNATASLVYLAMGVSYSLDDKLGEMRPFLTATSIAPPSA